MQQREWYKDWFSSPFYHKLYFERDESEARAFIQRLLYYLQPPPESHMLDVACGRGRHSRILAEAGYEVTGIDLSANSIEYARQFEKDQLHFYVHYAEQHLVHNEIKQINDTIYEIHRWQDDDHFYKKIIITDPSLNEPATFTEQVAKFSLGDFTDMLAFQKMQITEVFGDYQLRSYHIHQSPRMIMIARKNG